jgi:hypothetical protein
MVRKAAMIQLVLSFGVPLLLALHTAESADTPTARENAKGNNQEPEQVTLQGNVVCLPEEMHKLYQAPLPTNHEHVYGFKTADGTFFTLLRGKFSEALFLDEKLRTKQLLVKGRVFPQTRILEVSNIKTVRDGVVHDAYYYCAVCEIFAVAPGICECCQGPTELVEKPLRGVNPPE